MIAESADHLADPVQPVSAWNIANALTVLRLLMVPVFVVCLMQESGDSTTWLGAALVVFLVASVTDTLDGRLARSRGLVTDFGKIADPIADKALTGAAFIGLSVLDQLSWWVTYVVLGREIGVTLLRFWVIRHGVIPASRGGKLKTGLQMLAISLYILPLSGALEDVAVAAMAAAVLATLASGADYVVQAVRLRRAARRGTPPT